MRGCARLLLAEDNAINQKVAVKMLESLGYRVDVAADGAEAVEALSRIPYSAVLMDVHMPEMDGYEATREFRRREERNGQHRIPIIALTASALQGDRETALAAGMDDYVSKPVKREILKDVLDRWISSPETGVIQTDATPQLPIAQTQEEIIDRNALDGLRRLQGEGEPDILEELISLFLDDAQKDMENLKRAVEQEDAESIERVAHTLKGSSGNLGAVGMARISGELEQTSELFGQLTVEFERVRAMLLEVLAVR